MIKGSASEEDITFINIGTLLQEHLNISSILKDLKTDSNTIIMRGL